MSSDLETEVGFIKYVGQSVQTGAIDAASAGSALLGLDEAIRFFNLQQSPDLANLQYEVPVRTRAGSWEATVVVGAAVAAGAGAFAIGYLQKAGQKMAENDFKDIGLKDVFMKSMSAVQNLAKLTKHTRRARGWENARFAMDGNRPEVEVVDASGRPLRVPAEFVDWYQSMPPRLLVRMTSVIRPDRSLVIGANDGENYTEVLVRDEEKSLFDETLEDDSDDLLFPELLHGQNVKLVGKLIRGNQASNSVGLEYKGHILNCVPEQGSIRRFKPALFLRCVVEGTVTRHAKNRFVADRKPSILVRQVMPLEPDGQGDLFAA